MSRLISSRVNGSPSPAYTETALRNMVTIGGRLRARVQKNGAPVSTRISSTRIALRSQGTNGRRLRDGDVDVHARKAVVRRVKKAAARGGGAQASTAAVFANGKQLHCRARKDARRWSSARQIYQPAHEAIVIVCRPRAKRANSLELTDQLPPPLARR